jgi:signal transduction histidine kinase
VRGWRPHRTLPRSRSSCCPRSSGPRRARCAFRTSPSVLADGDIVSYGRRGAVTEEVELTYGSQHVGSLVVTPRPGGLGRAGRRLLTDLARRAGVAAHSVLLERELRRSREALVTAREEERRRIYRELHDGLGPSLAALSLRVETARELVDRDAGRAAQLLDEALPRLKATVADVRTVVHGLRPAALDDLGLSGALRELGGRFAGPRLMVDVAVRLDAAVPLPAAVEVATYRITAEALANAARHAGAEHVRVAVEQGDGALSLVVEDDGRGISPRRSSGVGLASMRERAAELGGMLTVGRVPHGPGTRVSARLPVVAR